MEGTEAGASSWELQSETEDLFLEVWKTYFTCIGGTNRKEVKVET